MRILSPEKSCNNTREKIAVSFLDVYEIVNLIFFLDSCLFYRSVMVTRP